jgi:plastocyanin
LPPQEISTMPTSGPGRLVGTALATLAVTVSLSACGGDDRAGDAAASDGATAQPSATPDGSTTPQASVHEIEVEITSGTVDTAQDSVDVAVGDTVRVTVTSDVDDELHVHGVDRTAELAAGRPTTLEFTVDEPGVYEVETHESGLLLFQLLVR